ncbi:hypothetical protein EYR41_009711 [Orbilia oligospora]|uniref:Uncharacterized protein n=1 Tax=Orbilia oligospora TaxID=2813651 RepID=A0A7C8P7U8_ORBOL|nr:hypothetical protein TWF751_009042 [Orbilia oligospora]TGJ65766.1 hypothetical protein EYR41_009711 [Orbilia oligospora]
MITELPGNLQIGYATDFPPELSTKDSYRCEIDSCWPKYMYLGDTDILVPLRKDPWLRQFQILLVYKAPDSSTMRLVGAGSSIPFYWSAPDDNDTLPDGGWDALGALAIKQHYFRNNMTAKLRSFKARTPPDIPSGVWDPSYSSRESPNALCALAVCILPEFRTSGLAERVIELMRSKCITEGYKAYVVPVRPTRKTEFKAMEMPIYLQMRHSREFEASNGASALATKDTFDPWVRKHISIGGKPIKIANNSMVLRATGKGWDDSADSPGMCEKAWKEGKIEMNEYDGEEYVNIYDVPGTLGPVRYYWKKDEGVYCEPNLWIRHI